MWTNLNIFLFCIVYAASTDETFKSDTKFWQFNLCTPLEIYFLASLSGHIDCHGNPPDLETTSVGVDVDGQEPWATTINSTGSFIVEYSWPKMNTEYGKDGIKTDLTFLLPNVIINFDGSIIELLDNSWKVSWSSPGFMEYVVKDTKKLDLRQNCQATVDVKLFYTFASADKRNPMYFILYDKTDFQEYGILIPFLERVEHYQFEHFAGTETQKCYNIPSPMNNIGSSLNTCDQCVILYDKENCQGKSLKIANDLNSNEKTSHCRKNLFNCDFDNQASSYKFC